MQYTKNDIYEGMMIFVPYKDKCREWTVVFRPKDHAYELWLVDDKGEEHNSRFVHSRETLAEKLNLKLCKHIQKDNYEIY